MGEREYELELKKFRLLVVSIGISVLVPALLAYLSWTAQRLLTEREAQFA